jgi:ZIP family zinc transporter
MYSLETVLIAFGLTLLAGLSTGIGAALAFFSKSDNTRLLSIGLGFSAGVMIYISFAEILVKSKASFSLQFSDSSAEALMLACFFLGIALAFGIDRLIPEDVNPHELKTDQVLAPLKTEHRESKQKMMLHRTGVFTALAIAIHNFPEGFATFVSALDSLTLGLGIALAVAIHNIPEGMAVSLPIYHATGERKRAFWYAFASGLAEPIGAALGFFLLMPLMGELTLGITFGIVAGIMIYISLDELLPSARVYGNAHTAIAGIVGGMGVMAVSLLLFKIV